MVDIQLRYVMRRIKPILSSIMCSPGIRFNAMQDLETFDYLSLYSPQFSDECYTMSGFDHSILYHF